MVNEHRDDEKTIGNYLTARFSGQHTKPLTRYLNGHEFIDMRLLSRNSNPR